VDAEFFHTFGVPVRGGFNPADDGSTPTAVIDSVAARALFGDGDPIGHMIKLGPPSSTIPWIRVVGVSRHVRWRMPNGVVTSTMDPQVYLLDRRAVAPPFRTGDAMWYVRPARDLEATFAAVRERTPSASLTLFDDANWRNMFDRMITFIAGLFTAFAAVGLVLAMIGVYGVLAHSVSQRTREFGVRIAFGATTGDLVRLVLMQANVPVLAGLALGLVAGNAGESVIGYFVAAFVSEAQIGVYLIAPLAIFAATVVAGLAPALRASRTSPTEAIRGA
jgi:putative ABC transport system permease protein